MRLTLTLSLFFALVGPALHAAEPTNSQPNAPEKRHSWLIPSLHAAGVLLSARLALSIGWPESFAFGSEHDNLENFERAWTQPPHFDETEGFFEWDEDPWPYNAVAHGLMGSEIYLRHRQADHSRLVAFAMTVLWSGVWEYLIESWHKRPSSVDLVWTPVGGLLLGEGRFRLYGLVRRMRPTPWRHLLLYLVDPLGQLERDLLGLEF